jgi:membrane-associated phospholipid phosphatase
MDEDGLFLTNLAHTLGTHALPGFFVGMVAMMAVVAGVWRVSDHLAMPREQGEMPRVAFLAMHVGLGFALVVSAAGIFASLAENLDEDMDMGALDLVFSAAVRQSVSIDTLRAFAFVTQLGDRTTLIGVCLVVAVVLAATKRYWLSAGWVMALAGNGLLNQSLKKVFERVRPEHDHGLVHEQGYSFPSGHTSGSVVVYGMLAYLFIRLAPRPWHLPALLCATIVAFTTAWSRVFLQVHYATDVLAGFASGTVWLVVCVASFELARYYQRVNAPVTAD